jgi:hypothetical protein
MRSLRVSFMAFVTLLGALSVASAQDVTPAVPEPQAAPTPMPTIPSDLNPAPTAANTPAVSPVPTRTPTKVLAPGAPASAPDMTVSAPRARRKEAAVAVKSQKSFEPPATQETPAAAPAVGAPTGGEPPSPPSAEPPRPTDADAFAPLASAPKSEADTQAAEPNAKAGPLGSWLLGGLLLVAAAVTVTVVSRRKRTMVVHITD